MPDESRPNDGEYDDVRRLLARAPVIRSAAELDLLVFLYRHPRTLLTNEQLAAFVGYDMKQVATSIDAFVEAGLLERTQNPMHAARMYVLMLEGPQRGGFAALLEMASTRQGRSKILEILMAGRSEPLGSESRGKRRLRAIA
jgi:DNA-binding MarR family transcriptional regulator